jgi:two-component system, LuxR family, sensor kinase FixL
MALRNLADSRLFSAAGNGLAAGIYREIVDSLVAHVAVIDHRGEIIAVNSAWRKFAIANGVSARHVDDVAGVGRNYLSICGQAANDGAEFARDATIGIQKILSGELNEFRLEYPCHSPLSQRWFEMYVAPLTHERQHILITHTDASRRVVAEQARTASRVNEIRLQAALDHATDAFFLQDDTTRVIDANRQACESLGYFKSEIIGMIPPDFDPDSKEPRTTWIREQLKTGEVVAFDSRHRRKDGDMFPVEVRIRPFWVDGKRYGLSSARDITARKEAENAVQDAQELMANALRHANIGLWHWNLKTNEVTYSREWKAQLGYAEAEIADEYSEWESRVHPDDLGPAQSKAKESISERRGEHEVEYRLRHKDGSWRWILARGSIVLDESGGPEEMIGVNIDITERKRAEVMLRSQLRILKRVATGDALPEVLEQIVEMVEQPIPEFVCSICTFDEADGRLCVGAGVNVRPELQRILESANVDANAGEPTSERNVHLTIFAPQLDMHPFWKDANRTNELDIYSCWSTPIYAYGTKGANSLLGTFLMFGRNARRPSDYEIECATLAASLAGIAIERHQSEAAIRDEEDRLRTLLENLPNVAVCAFEPDATITLWNRACERIYGFTEGEALGKDMVKLLHADLPSGEAERRLLADALRGESFPEAEEVEVILSNGAKVTVLSNRVLHQRVGRPPEFFRFDVDVSDKKRTEEQLAIQSAELVHASRLSTLGQMMAALSHEVAQPLTAIGNFAAASSQLLEKFSPASHGKLQNYVQHIAEQNQRCAAILQRLRDFSRRHQPTRSSCDVAAFLDDSIELVANELRRRHVRVRKRISDDLPPIMADRIQLQQVIVNLLTNACDAVQDLPPERRHVTLRARLCGGVLEILVEDRGHGFDPRIADRLFEPFVTTKRDGLGIGLNVCKAITLNHGGEIGAFINPTGGATFRVALSVSGAGPS